MDSPEPDDEIPRPERKPLAPWQFSLGTLLFVMTLVGVTVGAFTWHIEFGILAYLGCFSLFMIVCRTRAKIRSHLEILFMAVGVSILIGLASAIAFVVTCTTMQIPFVTVLEPVTDGEWFAAGLFVSMPLGTAAALIVYWLTWPRK